VLQILCKKFSDLSIEDYKMDRTSFTLLFEIISHCNAIVVPVLLCVCRLVNQKIVKHPDYLRTYLNSTYSITLKPNISDCLDAIKQPYARRLYMFVERSRKCLMVAFDTQTLARERISLQFISGILPAKGVWVALPSLEFIVTGGILQETNVANN
jgi:hypothetical protein